MEEIACNLAAAAEPEAQASLGEVLLAALTESTELTDGYSFRLSADRLVQVSQWMAAERLCCSFFRFETSLEPGADEMVLSLTGGEGVKSFIAENVVAGLSLQEGSQEKRDSSG